MPNTFDSTPQALTQKALNQNFSLEEKGRRESVLLNKDFYYGKQEQQLVLVNEDQDPHILNLTKPVIKKRTSLLYKKPLVREFEGPSQSISFIEKVYADNNIDAFLLAVDLASELTGSALVHPQTTEEKESGIFLHLYDASACSVVPDEENPSLPGAISLVRLVDRLSKISTPQNPQVERILRSQIWTDQSVVVYDGTLLKTSETNELGFLPFVNFRGEEVYDQYFGHAPSTGIRKLNELINQHLTHLGYMIKMQAATPIALAGYQSSEGVIIHPGRAFSIPAGADAKVLDLDPKIEETLAVLQYLEEKIFETSSVPKVTIIGGEGESGRELMIRWFPLLQVFEEKTVRFDRYELDLANMILRVAGLPPLESVKVNWPDEDLLPLSAEEEALERDISLNIKTPIDEIMRRDPNLTEEEAQAIALANQVLNATLLARPGNDQESDEQTEEGDEEEEEENNPGGLEEDE